MSTQIQLMKKNWRFIICLSVVIIIISIGVIGPYLTVNAYDFVGGMYQPPSWETGHILGTDLYGRDVWAELVLGIHNSLIVGFISSLIGLFIAVVIGGFAGYIGGIPDLMLSTFVNVILVIPLVPLLMVFSVLFKVRSIYVVAGIIAITMWPGIARSIRAQVLSLRERNFIYLAVTSGKSNFNIIFREIFPNMLAYIFTLFCGMVGGAIMAEAGISLLGLGPSTTITLGMMLHEAVQCYAIDLGAWWWFIPPGLILLIFIGTLFLLSSTIDDILNPKLQGRQR